MSRFTIAKAKYPLLKPYLFYWSFKENLRNKTSDRQRYYIIRKYVMNYLKAAKVIANVRGFNKIEGLDSLFFAVKAENNYEKLIAFEAISKPLRVILDEFDFNNFIYNRILKYMNASKIDYNDICKEAEAYRNIRHDIIDNKRNYLTFTKNNTFGQYDFDAAIKAKATIVPIRLGNKEELMNEENEEEIIVNVDVLDLISYDDYKNLNKKEIGELVLKKIEGEKNE